MTNRIHHRTGAEAPRSKAALLGSTTLASVAALFVITGPVSAQQTVTLAPVAVGGEAPRELTTTSAITQQDIDREQPLTLRELFRDDPAITVPSGSTAAQKLYVHGIDQSKLNVTVDGAPQRNNVWHHNGNLTLDPIFLKSVAVDAGVAPADAGFGALGGAVRFATKDARDMLLPGQMMGGTAILGYDTNSRTWRTTGAGYAANHGFEVLGIGSLARGKDYENGAGRREPGTANDLTSGLGKLAYESGEGHRLQVSGEHVKDEGVRRLRANLGILNNAQGRLLNTTRATRTTVTAGYQTTKPTDLFDPKINLYVNRNRLERPLENRLTTPHGAFNADVKSVGGTVQNSFAIPTGKLTAGFDFYRDDASLDRFHFTTNVDERITGVGGFVQARLSPLDRLRLSTGLRVDHQSYRAVDGQTFDNSGLSPNLSAEVDLIGGLTAFGGYSYNWGGLEMAETALFHAANYRYAPNLKPVTSHNARAGLRYVQDGLTLEGALFRTLMENPMEWNYTTRVRINGPDLKSQGFDLAAGYDWRNAAVGAKFTHTDVTYGGRMALPSDYNAAAPVGDLLTLRGQYTVESLRLTLGASSEIALAIEDDALRAAGFGKLESYQVANLFAEWQPVASLANWTLRVEANNLFDEAYSSRSTYAQTSVITPVLAEGRSFYLSSTLKF
ncbi:TonB-dependent receptor domain-containing protein [Azospirillum soli]|uniref:TonB-dependent receptor domain-containing protein n=1 Tax=Azospirillum soli TaxID=1304799 RepID=UPI001AE5199D|nr:TonB-dependent receptor [Azospirillum soli]MBP2315727.1 hemoglobin/transferrin/lactoferrin receptor protein [Azospirillum soli]